MTLAKAAHTGEEPRMRRYRPAVLTEVIAAFIACESPSGNNPFAAARLEHGTPDSPSPLVGRGIVHKALGATQVGDTALCTKFHATALLQGAGDAAH